MGSIAPEITPGIEYKLPRGGREAVRLSAQHHMLTSRQGWLLHPTIAEAIKDNPQPRIADVATGTGIWALEVARQLPHADVVGLDISDAQFPPEWTTPSNCFFGLHDLLEEVPSHLRGAFDVVHVRLLLAAGPAVDKSVFIEAFHSLLRPGGWLQWDDLNHPNTTGCIPSLKQKGQVETISLHEHPIVSVVEKYLSFEKRIGWISDFENIVTATGGFDRAERVITPIWPHLLQTETDLEITVKTELMKTLVENKKIVDPVMLAEIHGALAALHADVERGVMFSYSWNVCIAKKL